MNLEAFIQKFTFLICCHYFSTENYKCNEGEILWNYQRNFKVKITGIMRDECLKGDKLIWHLTLVYWKQKKPQNPHQIVRVLKVEEDVIQSFILIDDINVQSLSSRVNKFQFIISILHSTPLDDALLSLLRKSRLIHKIHRRSSTRMCWRKSAALNVLWRTKSAFHSKSFTFISKYFRWGF